MPPESASNAVRILEHALSLPAKEMEAYIRGEVAGDGQLMTEVTELLGVHLATDATIPATQELFAQLRVEASGLLKDTPSDPLIGQTVGSFRIIRLIGSGGMGRVYEARQAQPKRVVAVKVMRRGIASRSALRRFEFESQTLARLRHPGVAQLFEAGTHDDGQGGVPYFAMEYIPRAMPITEYAEKKKLGIRQRLELFKKVCEAVAHGHQKAVIHRDLKPANLLVDAQGEPRVIDFGVARATDSDMAVTTLQTDVGQLIGTMQYMSPEQCDADPHDLDITSDVYSLGMVLYELLCGRTAYDVKDAALLEAARMVKEDLPDRPSTIDRRLRGDIETVVMKAIEKERDDRYRSAAELADDIGRYLDDEPVAAVAPGMLDMMRRMARRHRAAFAAMASVAVILVAATVVSVGFSVQAVQAKDREAARANEAMAVKEFLADVLTSVDPAKAGEMDKELMKLVLADASRKVGESFVDQPLVEAELRGTIGATYQALGLYEDAEPHWYQSMEIHRRELGDDHLKTLVSIKNLGGVLMDLGQYEDAGGYLSDALTLSEAALGREHPNTLALISNMGTLHRVSGNYVEAEPFFREAIDLRRKVLGDIHPNTLASISGLAALFNEMGRYEEAEPLAIEVRDKTRRILGTDNPDTINAINFMAGLYTGMGRYEDAEASYRQSLAGFRRILGDDHPTTLLAISSLGMLLAEMSKLDEADGYVREAMEGYQRVLGSNHPQTLLAINNMGYHLVLKGRFAEAEVYLRDALAGRRRILGDNHPDTLTSISNMYNLFYRQRKYEEAEQYAREFLERSRSTLGNDSPDTVEAVNIMGTLYFMQRRFSEAEPFFIEALAGSRRLLGDDHPETLGSIANLGALYAKQGRYDEAEELIREALAAFRRTQPDHRDTLSAAATLGYLLFRQQEYEESEALYRTVLVALGRTLGDDHEMTHRIRINLGNVLLTQEKYGEAVPHLMRALEGFRTLFGSAHPGTVDAIRKLITAYEQWGRLEEAQAYRDMLRDAAEGETDAP